jgi:peptidoglycan L-alanyl-D-glutamate endopeptidase CwlK
MLTARDMQRLAGVHPDLVRVISRARASADFIVTEGRRTEARQRQLVAAGA